MFVNAFHVCETILLCDVMTTFYKSINLTQYRGIVLSEEELFTVLILADSLSQFSSFAIVSFFHLFINTFVTETPLDSISLLKMLPQRHQDLAFPNQHGSGLFASELALVYSTQKRTNGVWLLRQPVSVAQRNRQLSSQ